jgi:hypothetical protein
MTTLSRSDRFRFPKGNGKKGARKSRSEREAE